MSFKTQALPRSEGYFLVSVRVAALRIQLSSKVTLELLSGRLQRGNKIAD